MRVLFAGQVPKDPTYPEANEDALAVVEEHSRIAISDGASESFDSRTWAALLVAKFVQKPSITQEWLNEVLADYLDQHDIKDMSWSKQASFERGSFATLLGVESFSGREEVEILSIGDSLAVLLQDGNYDDSYPYSDFEDFKKRPELFCTMASHNVFFRSTDFFVGHKKKWDLKSKNNPVILCMTDALGEWALRNSSEGNPQWAILSSITELPDLESLVLSERAAKRMRIDDVTLVRIDPFGFD
jgi:hypothetical protein